MKITTFIDCNIEIVHDTFLIGSKIMVVMVMEISQNMAVQLVYQPSYELRSIFGLLFTNCDKYNITERIIKTCMVHCLPVGDL